MKAKALGMVVVNGKPVKPGDIVELTEKQYKGSALYFQAIAEPPIEKKAVEKAAPVEKKAVKKK